MAQKDVQEAVADLLKVKNNKSGFEKTFNKKIRSSNHYSYSNNGIHSAAFELCPNP